MDYVDVQTALEKLAAEKPWGTELRVTLDDRQFKEAEAVEAFIRHSIVFGQGDVISLGAECFRYPGLQYLSIFYRGGKGNIAYIAEAQKIVRYFNPPRTVDNIVFQTAYFNKLPPDPKGFAQIQVVCPFYFDSRSQ